MASRFRALNTDSSEESEGENDAPIPTKEALEDKASALYSEALQYQGNSQWDDAEILYQQLLESEVLTKVNGRVTFIDGHIKPSLEHLKYSCYQNLGHVLVAKNQLENGLECYKKALELDDTNLNLWYKIGLLGMKLVDLNVAISAFEMALEISPRHFPTLDNMISATYAQGGLLSCLYYIARALEYNPKFKKGLALKDRIFKDHPSLKEHYVLFDPYPDYKLDPEEVSDIEPAAAEKWYQEVMSLREAQRSVPQPQPHHTPEYSLPCRPTTWLQLSLLLSATHTQFMEEAPQMDFYRPVHLLSERQFSDVDMEVGAEVEQMSVDEEVDNINNEAANDVEDAEPSGVGVRGKRRRSSPTCLDQQSSWMSGKRRSARTRNTNRKEEPTLARTLTNLLPSSLLLESEDGKKDSEVVRWNEDSMDTMDMFRLFGNKDTSEETREMELTNCLSEEERSKIIKEEGYFGSEMESSEVSNFLETNSGCDILTLIERTVLMLSDKWKRHWPTSLPAIYVQLYKVYLQHNPPSMNVPSLLKTEEEGAACVLYGELLLDYWLKHGKSRNKPSPLGDSCLGGEFPSLLLGDLHDLRSCSSDPVFITRSLWMNSLFSLYNDEISTTVQKLCIIQNYENLDKVNVRLVNVTNHFIINKSTVETMLTTLNRKQMVDELAELYERDDCEQIVAILTEVLQPSKLSAGMFQPSLPRDAQYSLLLYTLKRLDRDHECMRWAEMFVHESVKQLLAAVAEDNCELRTKWFNTINNTIICILSCANYGGSKIFGALEKNRLPRLVQSLIHVICRQIESGQVSQVNTGPDKCQDSQFEVVASWVLLYNIITHCEENVADTRQASSAEERLPSSIRLLFTAHEYLGRRAWCCLDEGVILYQILYQLQTLIDRYYPESEEYSILAQQLEQIFYCLYGHPMKRNKPRYVQEHNVNGLELTWARSHQVLSLLRPKELPTYDSASKCSISTDTETLLQRIIQLVPPEINPKRLYDQMTKYIEGSVDEIPENNNPLPTEMADIYYLIADYHFKAKAWKKSLRYHTLDVCNNPERVDSWACLALARGSMLETKLNSCDALKSELEFLQKAQMSCRCYKTSLELDSGLPTLWIEYGSFSYMVHSFCSRLLKQEQKLNLEMFETLETQKESMIQAALHCFSEANKLWYTEDGQEMQDERWLHHYMLGKIAEKKQEPTSQCLSHYLKSMEFLHLNNAMYPSLVTYNSPQYLAVEALELYYRIHAVILKTLEQSEDKPIDPALRTLFRETIEKVAAGSFARRVTRSEESEGANSGKKTIYIDSEETRMATVKRLMDSVLELVEANVDVEDQTNKIPEKRPAETSEQQPAKRVKREDSETSDRSKDEKKGSKASKKTSSESSSASDSDSESSSSESTTSDSSEDSDDSSDEDKSTDDKKEEGADSDDDKGDWKKEQEYLTTACLDALEDCAQRFPEHYKSLYRLAHFYFRSKLRRNVEKARQLLLGEKGLFADRKPSNFFNGVWRIPSNEIDRPGSFASHMSRCVLLLVDVLRDTCDHKMLFDLALHLKDTPEADKKYLRDPEREELSKEALSLSVQTLRRKLTEAKSEDDQKTILIEIYKVYKLCSKHWDVKQGQFVTLLTDAFSQYKEENNGGFDAAVKFCTQEIAMQKAAATPTPSSAPQTAFSSPDVSQASSPAPLMPPMQQKPLPMPTPPVKRGRGRPSTSSLRQQNPNAFKQNYRSSAEELAQFYRNMVTMQMMNQSKAGQSGPLLNQQMLTNAAAMALSYQTEMYQQLLLQQQQVQKAAQLQAMKDHTKVNITPVSSHQKPDTSTKASSLLAPSKVSVFSSQSILLPNQKPVAKQTSKPQSSLSISPVVVSTPNSAIYQHGTQTQFTPARAPVQPSPFQQKIPVEPKVSLQHKLLSAKMGKQITTSLVTSTQQQSSVIASSDRTKHTKDKISLQKTSSLSLQKSSSLPTAALSSRGVSIIPAKLPEIKIPKDITLGHGLSISPLNSSKSKSSLSPSTSKEVTVTLMKSQSDLKNSKAGSSVSVSLLENKKSQLSPGGGRNSPSATLRMGSSVTITPAKPVKSVPQVKPIPKADFSISLSKPTDTKKKDGSDVIIIE